MDLVPGDGVTSSDPQGMGEEIQEVFGGSALLPDPSQVSRVPLPRVLL